MRTPTVRILAVVAACLLVAAGCSDDDNGDTETSGTTTGETGSFELVSDGTLTICSDIPYTPFEFYAEDRPTSSRASTSSSSTPWPRASISRPSGSPPRSTASSRRSSPATAT